MYGSGVPWGKIHADRRAREADGRASQARGEAMAWKARARELAVLVSELADQAHPSHVQDAPGCRCRGCCGELMKEIWGRNPTM
ncbi:hypothetical protein Srubr_66420 [Streptomyces rubradiris]|uniref:Uncharacterized protein n=1 Tax=Streptomyces rubradiris TaxID=285531 RepID=A0ABQ3RLQ7_STRRR|nr:hypothetical protein GCM10018792_32390 [Streptomyces rubradiris]GHI56796.1 hypothetical protein Srubr_66420 [Streptomyces rubradiris]